MILVHARVPPKPDSVILKKARKSSAWVGIGAAAGECGTLVSDMAETFSLQQPLRPIDLWGRRQMNHNRKARPGFSSGANARFDFLGLGVVIVAASSWPKARMVR